MKVVCEIIIMKKIMWKVIYVLTNEKQKRK